RAVDALPDERVVWLFGEAVIGELLSQKTIKTRSAKDLGELTVVAERVGQPAIGAARTEFGFEEPLTEEKLPDERFSGGDVAVGLDPGATDRQPLTATDTIGDSFVEIRLMFLDPGVLLCLRAGEAVVRIAVDEVRLRCERADALAVGLRQRPEPGCVDVRVANCDDFVRNASVATSVEVS